MAGRRIEVFARGFDPTLQALGGDPTGNVLRAGLRIPALATTDRQHRYLFQLATYGVPQGKCVRLTSVKQLVRIGLNTSPAGGEAPAPAYPLVLTVRDPAWTFVDGNISWHLRLVRNPPNTALLTDVLNTDSFHKRWCDACLVFETATFNAANLNAVGTPDNYTALTAYAPPFGGTIPGEPIAGLGTFGDLRFPYDANAARDLEETVIHGGGHIVLYASVFQPSGTHTATITVPEKMSMPTVNLDEEAFLEAWPTAQYWTVGGGFTVEEADLP